MFILGILSILQMVCLPGLLVQRLFPLPSCGVPKWVSVFGFSLLINFLLIVSLTLLGLYIQPTLWVVLALEIASILWLYRKNLLIPVESIAEKVHNLLGGLKDFRLRNVTSSHLFKLIEYVVFGVLAALAVVDIIWLVKIFYYNFGTVFNTWDAVVSWNRWAVDWAQGSFPLDSSYYPQLLPVNWSISYVLLNGVELQFFPKLIMPLFSIFILLMLFDLGVQTRSFGFFIAIIFTRLLIKKYTGEYIADGYMDLPSSFFGFSCIYLLLRAHLSSGRGQFNINWIIASGLMAAAAALTKQSGLFILLLFPLLAWVLVLRSENSLSTRYKFKLIASVFGSAFLLILLWYGYKYITITLNNDSSNIAYVTSGIYGDIGLLQRASDALVMLGTPAYFLIALPFALFFVKPAYRWINILVVIPYTIIWLFWFSYEARNLALIFPLWAIILGLMLEQIFSGIIKFASRLHLHKIPVIAAPVLIMLFIAIGAMAYPSERLVKIQEEQQWQILDPQLNESVRSLVSETGTDIRVLSMYPIDFLPGMRGTRVSFGYNNYPDYLQALKDPQINYLLVPASVNEDIERDLQAGLSAGKFDLLFTSGVAYPSRMFRINP